MSLSATGLLREIYPTDEDLDELYDEFNGDEDFEEEADDEVLDDQPEQFSKAQKISLIEVNNTSCSICFLEFDGNEYVIPGCGHRFCRECLSSFLDFELNNHAIYATFREHCAIQRLANNDIECIKLPSVYGLKCPGNKCNCIIPRPDMTSNKDDQTKIFVDATKLNRLDEEANSRCPSPACGLPRHNGDCEAYRRWYVSNTMSEILFGVYASQIVIKACPKCRSPIEKNGGCNHMHCSRCDTDFGWNGSSPVVTGKRWNAAATLPTTKLPPQIRNQVHSLTKDLTRNINTLGTQNSSSKRRCRRKGARRRGMIISEASLTHQINHTISRINSLVI